MSAPDLVKIFEESMMAPEFAPNPNYKPKPKFKPSSLGSPCLRKIFYSYLKVEKDFEPDFQGQLIFRLGDFYGDVLSKMYRKAGILVDYIKPDGTYRDHLSGHGFDYEFPLNDYDLELSSKVDAVLVIDGKLWLGEWKSIGANGWGYLKGAKPEHKIQGAIYLYLFKEALRAGKFSHIPQLADITDVEGVIFMYWNKETNERRQYVHTDLEKEFENTINKIFSVKDHAKKGELPPKTVDWCQSCEYRLKCARDYKPENKLTQCTKG